MSSPKMYYYLRNDDISKITEPRCKNIQLIIFAMLYNLANVHLSSTNEIFFLGRGIKPSVPSFLPQLNLSSTLLC